MHTIVCMNYSDRIQKLRLQMGLTQTQLAIRAGVSLPTIQKIEAGIANPGFEIVETIFSCLNQKLHFVPKEPDWDSLANYGVPLSTKHTVANKSEKALLILVRSALDFFETTKPEMRREWEAFAAFLLALKTHFGPTWKKLQPFHDCANELIGKVEHGRLLKLRRLSIAQQASYL